MMSLGLLSPGERCEIIEVRQPGSQCCKEGGHKRHGGHHGHGNIEARAEEMGLRAGKQVEMLKNDGRLLLLLVDEARIAIDRRMAMKIMVRR